VPSPVMRRSTLARVRWSQRMRQSATMCRGVVGAAGACRGRRWRGSVLHAAAAGEGAFARRSIGQGRLRSGVGRAVAGGSAGERLSGDLGGDAEQGAGAGAAWATSGNSCLSRMAISSVRVVAPRPSPARASACGGSRVLEPRRKVGEAGAAVDRHTGDEPGSRPAPALLGALVVAPRATARVHAGAVAASSDRTKSDQVRAPVSYGPAGSRAPARMRSIPGSHSATTGRRRPVDAR
jgi:hypothetical protein